MLLHTASTVRRFCKEGRLKDALRLLDVMAEQGVWVKNDVCDAVLQECIKRKSLADGERVRAHMVRRGWETSCFLGTNLVRLYASCGKMWEARKVFDKLMSKNVISWSAMIQGHTNLGQGDEALRVFEQMLCEGVRPDKIVAGFAIKACASLGDLGKARQVHGQIFGSCLESDAGLDNAVMDMYVKCGSMEDARKVFDTMAARDLISWTTMVAGYAQYGIGEEAFRLYEQMRAKNVELNAQAYACVLRACATLGELDKGRQVHADLRRLGYEDERVVASALINMYTTCGRREVAEELFGRLKRASVDVWNTMLAGYVKLGQGGAAVQLYSELLEKGVRPDRVTFVNAVNACASIRALRVGQQIHKTVGEAGYEGDMFVVNALLDMYTKCGRLATAHALFDRMEERSVVSWTTVIAGYVRFGLGKEALSLYLAMLEEQIEPSWKTFPCVLVACAQAAALEQGRRVHALIRDKGLLRDTFIGNSLVDMYAKCGSIEDSRQVFDELPQKDTVSWTAMLTAYNQHGLGREALQLLNRMEGEGVVLDSVAYVAAISACARLGLVSRGEALHHCMVHDAGLKPTEDHCASMVELFGRAGQVQIVQDFIYNMPYRPGPAVWMALLTVCRFHGVVELAQVAADNLFDIEQENPVPYVMLANTYASVGRWDDEARVRQLMREKGARSETAVCSMELGCRIHELVAGDGKHPQSQEIHSSVDKLMVQIRNAGYQPASKWVLHDVDEDERRLPLHLHCEKLAVACGLLNTPPGTPIRIVKNVRVCGDCHNAIKYISRVVNREILVRDPSCFHRFKDGLCTCGEYW